MTIKEFSRLCGCNPQTLRYYDHMDLLKPVKVDKWSGYRFYDEEQALLYVKIKNLQTAGFTIEEIKGLLDADNSVIYEAFSEKIQEQEARLRKTLEIRESYHSEMTMMQKKIESIREQVRNTMEAYDPAEEFGIDRDFYDQIINSVNDCFESMIKESGSNDYEYSDFPDGDDSEEEWDFLDFLNNPVYKTVYEKHGWNHVKDFYTEFSKLEKDREYALLFKVSQEKARNSAFLNTILGMLLYDNPGRTASTGCNTFVSEDGQNHFWLLRRKQD